MTRWSGKGSWMPGAPSLWKRGPPLVKHDRSESALTSINLHLSLQYVNRGANEKQRCSNISKGVPTRDTYTSILDACSEIAKRPLPNIVEYHTSIRGDAASCRDEPAPIGDRNATSLRRVQLF